MIRTLNGSQLRMSRNYHFQGLLNTANDFAHDPNEHSLHQGS